VPQRVDEVLPAPLSRRCPCGARYKWSAPSRSIRKTSCGRTVVRRFDIDRWAIAPAAAGAVDARAAHPLQTSDALGSAKVQVGPEALVLGAHILNKQMGLSLGPHGSGYCQTGYGLEFSRGGHLQALARLAGKAEPTLPRATADGARQSIVNWVDETGWRVGGPVAMAVGGGERTGDGGTASCWSRLRATETDSGCGLRRLVGCMTGCAATAAWTRLAIRPA